MNFKTLSLGPSYQLAEGLIWSPSCRDLYWVDILAGEIYRYNFQSELTEMMAMHEPVGCVGFWKKTTLLAACRSGIYIIDWKKGKKLLRENPESSLYPENRFNDGQVDSQGNFWIGTMNTLGNEETGALYLLDSRGELRKMRTNLIISNGIGWSPKGEWMYHVDSGKKVIYRYSASGTEIGPSETFIETSAVQGVPDGMYVDREGDLWVAHWDGSCLSRWSHEGRFIETLEMPAKRPTSVTMSLDETQVYVASASIDQTFDANLKNGSIFSFQR